MRQVRMLRDVRTHGMHLRAGWTYLMEDPTLGHLLSLGAVGSVRDLVADMHEEGIAGKRVVLCRSGGFGDLLMLTPTLRSLLAEGCEVAVCCHKQYREALAGLPVEWEEYPMTTLARMPYDEVLWLEGCIEFAADPLRPAVDLLAEAAGVTLTQGRHLSYTVDADARLWVAENWPKHGRRVGVQLMASAPSRTYPGDQMVQVVTKLLNELGVEVFLLGAPGSIVLEKNESDRLVNLAAHRATWAQSAAAIESCDVVLGPDSAAVHLAAAIGTRAVALYGPFTHASRIELGSSVRVIEGRGPCAPCHWHGRGSAFPPTGPCALTGRCEVLGSISPELVVRVVGEEVERAQRRMQNDEGGAA
jgi:ADP-heptose:LPS heptosyltransferase